MATVVILGALTRSGHLEGPLLHDQVTVAKRYMVDDVQASIDSYTKHLGFEVHTSAAPAFADITRGNLRALLSGPTSSAGRPISDGAKPGRVAGTASTSSSRTSAPKWNACAEPDSSFATMSSPARAAPRSYSRTPPATSSSFSNPPGPNDGSGLFVPRSKPCGLVRYRRNTRTVQPMPYPYRQLMRRVRQ